MRIWLVYGFDCLTGTHGSQIEETEDGKDVREGLERAFSCKFDELGVEWLRESLEGASGLDTGVLLFRLSFMVMKPLDRQIPDSRIWQLSFRLDVGGLGRRTWTRGRQGLFLTKKTRKRRR
ncbi:hypothetical protein J0A71_09g20590 [Encephalitozoon cuniculi]|nr:hypothetical protein J0A71_02g04840 [Encephalitozoon cuniculi]UYI27764.1 hypothetical protein J0A71_07g16470 [Encephalitozoon cuniculi]UYI27992.1 hypothetical protein J0A71_09g18860 [Encephalitozoon cuniculi]UYI28161.1 hypothetical protein J0A71_09g20590 [Encephalitozoon cuniculi]